MKNVTFGKRILMVLVLCLICTFPFLANAEVLPSDIEWETAKSLGWIDDTAQPDEPCSKDQFYTLMNAMVKQRTGTTCEWVEWGTEDPMQRLYAPRVLYEAALNMGYSEKDSARQDIANINDIQTMMNSIDIWLCGEQWRGIDICPDYEEFCNDSTGTLPWEPDNWRVLSSWEFCTFAAKQECFVNGMPVMELTEDGRFHPYDAITMQEAVSAAFRLYCSFGDYHNAEEIYQAAEHDLQIGEAVEIHFTSTLLDREVRRQLDLAEDVPIYDYQLKKITALSFAGDQMTDVWCHWSEFGENNYFFDSWQGTYYGGSLVDARTGRSYQLAGWEFENLDEFALFPNLERLTVCSQQVIDITGIADLTKLRYLDLSQNHITDLSPLENLTELRGLFLFYNPLTEVTALQSLHNLNSLSIGRTNTVSLSGLEELPIMDLNMNSMACLTDISALAQMDALTTISCNGPRLYDASGISAAPNLNTMEISYLNDREAAAIGAMKSLRQLCVMGIHQGELTCMNLPYCKSLDIWRSEFDDLEWLHSDALEEFTVSDCYLENLNGIANLRALKTFNMSNSVTPDASDLVHCPGLTSAVLCNQAKESIQDLPVQSGLRIGWTQVDLIRDYTFIMTNVVVSADIMPKPIGYTKEKPTHIPVDELAAYDNGIITEELLALERTSQLPDAGIGVSAHWTGAGLESGWLTSWDRFDTRRLYADYYYEDYITRLKACGGNILRLPINYKWLNYGGPEWTVNSNQLAALDGFLATAIRNDVHILMTFTDIPLYRGDTGVFPGDIFNEKELLNYKRWLEAFAARYRNISNRYLDFELCPEAGTGGSAEMQEHQADTYIELANAVWEAEGNKPRETKRLISVTFALPDTARQVRLAQNDLSFYTHEMGLYGFYGQDTDLIYDSTLGDRSFYTHIWEDWPLVSMPGVLWSDQMHNTLTFTKESKFPKGTTFEIWADLGSPLEIYADQKKLDTLYPYETKAGTFVQSYGNARPMWKFALKKDTESVRFVNPDVSTGHTTIFIVEITLPDREPVRLFANFAGIIRFRNAPEESGEIRMADDLSCVGYVNGVETWFDAEYICRYLWMGDMAIADEYNVNFQISEVSGACPRCDEEVYLKIYKDFYATFQRHNISSVDKLPYDIFHFKESVSMPDGVPYYFDEEYYHAVFDDYAASAEEITEVGTYTILLDVCGELSLPKGQKIYAEMDTKSEVIYTTKAEHNNFFIAGAAKENHDGWIPVVLPGEVVGWLPPNARTEWVSY